MLVREIKAFSSGGQEFCDKTELLKRKYDDIIPAKEKMERTCELALT